MEEQIGGWVSVAGWNDGSGKIGMDGWIGRQANNRKKCNMDRQADKLFLKMG
jgi:hypothetical protein